MAKIKSKVLDKLKGSFENPEVTFREWKERQVLEKKPTPPKHLTPKRYIVRTIYKKLSTAWHYISQADKLHFREIGRKLGITAYNAFLRQYLTQYLTLRIFKTSEIEADSDLNMATYTVKSTRTPTEDADMINLQHLKYYCALTEAYAYRRPLRLHTMALSGALATLAVGANTLRALPWLVVKRERYDQIAIHVTTSASGTTVMLGLYDDAGTYPGKLIASFGSLDSASTGLKTATINLELEPGLYWLALISNGNPTLGGIDAAAFPALLGSTSPYVQPNNSYAATLASQTLPTTFPANAPEARIPYLVALRVATS